MNGYRILAVVGCVLMTGSSTQEARAAEGAVAVIAHRGASAYAPENTLAAFELAAKMKAQWFELDCTLTKDGEILVIHDDTVDRTTAFRGAVKDLDLAELKRYDAGSWFDPAFAEEGLPTLAEAIDLAGSRIGVYIEIKNADDDTELLRRIAGLAQGHDGLFPELRDETMALIEASGTRNLELTRKVIREVQDHGAGDRVVLQSFSPTVCAVALAEAPGLRTELLANSDDKRPAQWGQYLQWAGLLDVAGFNVSKKDITEELVARMHAEGRTVAVWTVNEEDDMTRMIGLGVDAIITDHPDVCLEIVARMEK